MRQRYSQLERWIFTVTSAQSSALILCSALLFTYCALPLVINITADDDPKLLMLAAVSFVAIIAIILGAKTPLFDSVFKGRSPRIRVNAVFFNSMLWSVFVIFVFVAWFTAPNIPLIAALNGADSETIAILREQFLKAREGWQTSFVYINAVLSGALIPYSLALMFLNTMRWRWLAAGFFLIFCISFMEKAFFLKAAFPLIYLVAQRQVIIGLSLREMLLGTLGLLLLLTLYSGGGGYDPSGSPFFSVSYLPQGSLDHLFWRIVAIPLITAADAIRVFQEQFSSQPLMGATSTFLASLFGIERIEYERLVFAAQWGQNETGTGSSNSVYITEAFVNFGWMGIFIFSFIIGILMRFFSVSRDEAFRAIWPLFVFGVFTSGLIGTMLSNGYLIIFLLTACIRLQVYPRASR
jgi:hypothetical protein